MAALSFLSLDKHESVLSDGNFMCTYASFSPVKAPLSNMWNGCRHSGRANGDKVICPEFFYESDSDWMHVDSRAEREGLKG